MYYEYVPESISCVLQPSNNKGGLYLGNVGAFLRTLNKYEIKAAISILEIEQFPPNKKTPPNYLLIQLTDENDSNIAQHFERCNQFIHTNLQVFKIELYNKETNVLVHCMAGISRSASIVIAYIMWSQKLKYKQALELVTSKRSIIFPNEGFRKQLQQYEKLLSSQNLYESSNENKCDIQ